VPKSLLTLALALTVVPTLLIRQKTATNCCTSDGARLSRQEIKALLNHTEPISPLLGDKVHIQGKIVVAIAVDASGRVAYAEYISGHPMMIAGTIASVGGWQFRPFTVHGVKKDFCGRVALRFEASEYGVKYEII
jgi:outer membrane biosynthesis protein TonB